ncbi:MAG: LPS-assembly protein LptD [Elusimicrobia bacterium]|nr:LPS-assembly protein LptD [Elusimicrobiota bacterium]
MKGALLTLLLALPAAAEDYALPPPPPGPHIDYSADKAEFDADHSSLHLSGGVVLKESSMTVKGGDIWIDTSRRTGRTDASLLAEDGTSAVYGDSGEFDFSGQTARLFQASAGSGDWRIHAREGELRPDRSTSYRVANFTSCERVPPDYHFHASTVRVVPKKYLFSTNTFFYLGPVPLLYMPFFYKSLESEPHLKWRFRPGYDRRDGAYLKGTLAARLSTSTYGKLFDDYYQNKGFGYGGELDHRANENSRGSLFGYRIKEDGTVNDRWGLFGAGYKTLTSSISFQGRLQYQSDPSFTNDYVRSDLFRLTPELVNSGAFTRTTPRGTVRLLYSRDDVQDPARANSFTRNTESLPRLEGQSTPFRLWKLPWLNSLNGFADNNYDRTRGYQQKSVNGSWEGTRSFVLVRGLSYTPKLGLSETYYSRFDETNYLPPATNPNLDTAVTRWTVSNNLRTRTVLGNLDATHIFVRRLKPDGLTGDTSPADKGVEQNRVVLSDVFVPVRRTWARLASGYDFATFRDHTIDVPQRFLPVTADLSWQATNDLSFTAHNDYQFGTHRGQERSVILDARWSGGHGLSVGGGVAYNLTTPGTYYQSLDFSFTPSSPTWHVAVGLRSLVDSPGGFRRARGARLFEKEITWTRRWHDFDTKVVARSRPGGVGEVSGNVELRFGGVERKRIEHRDWESEWFPGREKDSSDLRP